MRSLARARDAQVEEGGLPVDLPAITDLKYQDHETVVARLPGRTPTDGSRQPELRLDLIPRNRQPARLFQLIPSGLSCFRVVEILDPLDQAVEFVGVHQHSDAAN